jgi:hypothetical protein
MLQFQIEKSINTVITNLDKTDRFIIRQRTEAKCQMLTEDILDEIDAGPEHFPRTFVRCLHERPEFNVSCSKFAVFQKCNLSI